MTAALAADPAVDGHYQLLSWQISVEGRKHVTGSALYDERGDCLARARATWIEIAET